MPDLTRKLVPNWKQVMLKAYVVWVAVADILLQIAMLIMTNLEMIDITDQQKTYLRIALSILIIVLRPVKQKSLQESPTPAPERSQS